MLQDMIKVIRQGDANGNGMLIRIKLPSGHEILGCPTENAYEGEWALGPTWNYVVMSDKPFLVDTGKFGMGGKLLEMMSSGGVSGKDLDFVIVSHGHEDHDGSLAEIVDYTKVRVKAHDIYDRLIRYYPERAPSNVRKNFPASCWRCFMPESFSEEHCIEYQRSRSSLKIDTIKDRCHKLDGNALAYHVPGHSPDSLAIVIGGEALLVGDTVLPDITPWPSQEKIFDNVRDILQPRYPYAHSVYGLRAYISSLKKMKAIAKELTEPVVLPAHRLFYNGQWNNINLITRADELITHHTQRCGDILKILEQGPKTAREIAVAHFDENLLMGFGILMAENEVISHCELLCSCNDTVLEKDEKFAATGSTNFESAVRSLTPEW
jgi:glyoxylase-like metal-dependent hydrolase (beta-lactamase superfamily II)